MKYSTTVINNLFRVSAVDYYNVVLNYALTEYVFNQMLKGIKK